LGSSIVNFTQKVDSERTVKVVSSAQGFLFLCYFSYVITEYRIMIAYRHVYMSVPPNKSGMIENAITSGTSVSFYQTTRRYNPEDSHLLSIQFSRTDVSMHVQMYRARPDV
jgi:hypothetical protein